jgi:hypothetical protein
MGGGPETAGGHTEGGAHAHATAVEPRLSP